MVACLVGWFHSPFGKREGETLESLITEAARGAVLDSGVAFSDIDAIYVGNFGGFEKQGFPASFALNASPDLRFKPAVRIENACATGSAALHLAAQAVASGAHKCVLVVGAEKMTHAPTDVVGDALLNASYRMEEAQTVGGFAGIFGRIAQEYFDKYGDQSDAMAHIAAKNHKNGTMNPWAHMRKDLGVEFCREVSEKNPYVAPPLKRTDCSLVSDGSAAVVLMPSSDARARPKAVALRAQAHVQDYLPLSKRVITDFEGCQEAWKRAHAAAQTTLQSLSFVETHDCFTIAELIQYEAMGLTAKGEGKRAILEGWTQKGGRLPVNPSGGLKAKGHPIGATGVSMHIMAALQLMGQAGDMQVGDATLGGVFNMGGAAVANYVSILERLR